MNRNFSLPAVLAGLLCLLLLVSPPAPAADAPDTPTKVRTIEGVTEYALKNGLKVLLYPDKSTSKVTVNLTVLVGSRHEGYGETGMAHLLEHMLFKGTPKNKDIPKALKDHGAIFNATTSYDRTNYFETMPANEKNLEFALKLEADRFVNSLIRRDDLASEMTVVRNEFEAGENNPFGILMQRVWATAYEWHNYGKNTIGNRSDIERVPIENLQAFYKKHYRPDNAVLLVAGNFDPKTALELIAREFGPLKNPPESLDSTYTDEPAQDGERTVTLRRVGDVGLVFVAYHVPAASHADYAALEVLNQVLTSEPAGRIYQALVPTKKASAIGGFAMPLHDPSLIQFIAQVSPGDSLEKARDALLDVVEKFADQKPTVEEVNRAKQKLLKSRELLMNSTTRVAEALGEWAARGDWRLFFLHRDQIENVTPADVARVARLYLQPTNRTVGLYVPTKEPLRASIPPNPSVEKLVKDYKGGKNVAAGEAFDPTPDNIEKRTLRGQLPSGVKTALLSKKTRGEAVNGQLTIRYGNERSLKGLTTAAELLPTLLLRGTTGKSRQEIEDEMDRLQAQINAAGNAGVLRFTFQCKRESLPGTLKLLGEMLRQPAFAKSEFDILVNENRDEYKGSLTEPNALASRALQRKLAPYAKEDVRYLPTLPEEIERLNATTLEQVKKLYHDHVGGQVGELAIVGDFDAEPVLKQAEGFLSGWKAQTPYERIASPAPVGLAASHETINTPDKENAIYTSGLVFRMKDSDPDYPALLIANYALGGGPLSSRLADRVRKKEGLSYTVMSHFTAGALDPSAEFMFLATCRPANVDKTEKTMLEEIERFVTKGIEAKELEDSKKAFLASIKTARGSDSALAGGLARRLHAGRTYAFDVEQERQIKALTVDQVNAAVRKYLEPKKLITIRAGDFKPKQKAEK